MQKRAIHVEFSTDDLDGLYGELKAKRVVFHQPPHDEPWERSMTAFDLDGYAFHEQPEVLRLLRRNALGRFVSDSSMAALAHVHSATFIMDHIPSSAATKHQKKCRARPMEKHAP